MGDNPATAWHSPRPPMRRFLPLPLSVALSVFLSGCFYPADRGKALEAKVDKLQAGNAELSAALDDAQKKLAESTPRIDAKIAEVTTAMESLDKAARRSGADIGVQLQKSIEDLAALRGQVETYLYRLNELDTAVKALTEATDKKFVDLQGEEAARQAEADKKAKELQRPADKAEFLALAAAKGKAGDVPLSRQLYNEFLKKWSKDPLAAEAHFALGDSYFQEARFSEALYEFGKVVQDFPKFGRTPAAFLKTSESFAKLKLPKEARLALDELLKAHPASPEAKVAKARIAELDKAQKAVPPPKKAGQK